MTTNKIYGGFGTAMTFTETGAGTTLFTAKNMANSAGRISTQWDRGSGSLPFLAMVRVTIKAQVALAISAPVRIYMYCIEDDATAIDNGQSDAAISVETLLNNWKCIGQITASANAVGPFSQTLFVIIPGRYVSVGLFNASGQALTNVNGDNKIVITPAFSDIQAAA